MPNDTTSVAGAEVSDPLQRPLKRDEVGIVVRARGQRQVHVRAASVAATDLVGVARVVGVHPAWVGMQGDVEHVGTLPEDGLRAVAMVDVEVEDGDWPARSVGSASRLRWPHC